MPCVKKEAFKKAVVKRIEKIPLPELGEGEYVMAAELGSRDLLDLQEKYGKGDTANLAFVYDLLYQTLVDDFGERLFDSLDELKDTFNLSVSVIARLSEEILRISGLEPIEKNSQRQSVTR